LKLVHADATIKAHRFTTDNQGDIDHIEDFSIPVKTGQMIMIDVLGLHMNRSYFRHPGRSQLNDFTAMYWGRDVAEFKPDRF
jgi:hypothetical protein